MQASYISAQQQDTPGHQEHILVVDDESAMLAVLVSLLERSGYDVSAASNSEQALLHLQDDPGCELVLSDVMMPGGDGLSLLDVICRDYPGVSVVMLTAMQDVHVATSAFRRGPLTMSSSRLTAASFWPSSTARWNTAVCTSKMRPTATTSRR
jgi:CheY-like chemotaxis protein